MKSITYTVLKPHAYSNVLVLKYFLRPLIFHVRTYVRTYSYLLNPVGIHLFGHLQVCQATCKLSILQPAPLVILLIRFCFVFV